MCSRLIIAPCCCHAGKVLADAVQPANGQVITTAAGQQCLPLSMIRKPDGKLEFLSITLGQVRCHTSNCGRAKLHGGRIIDGMLI